MPRIDGMLTAKIPFHVFNKNCVVFFHCSGLC